MKAKKKKSAPVQKAVSAVQAKSPPPPVAEAATRRVDRVVIVTRETRLQTSVKRFNTKKQAKFFVESRGQNFGDYELEDANYQRALEDVLRYLPRDLNYQVVDRTFLPNYVFGERDLVLTLGQDGLVVNVAKYLKGQRIFAVNPDPDRFDGVLMPFRIEDTGLVEKVAEYGEASDAATISRVAVKHITMGRVGLNDGQELHAFNDFYIGVRGQSSARYSLRFQGAEERHISSGVIVSTPAGSTGWMSSLYNMSRGIAAFTGAPGAGGIQAPRLDWEERRLIFMVREPFRSNWSGADLVAGSIDEQNQLVMESKMASDGVIFSDGMLDDYLEFNTGAAATVEIAKRTTSLIMSVA